ncbi:MAG: hypothetical protein KGZ42_07305 [Melioribacter sp.]|nr:hypothetical protein [Melioribacter sp.]
MSDIIGIILIISFIVMSYSFSQLVVGRKKGDQQIINRLKEENEELFQKNYKLQNEIEALLDHKVRKIIAKYKREGE